jgi:hypothetical protein
MEGAESSWSRAKIYTPKSLPRCWRRWKRLRLPTISAFDELVRDAMERRLSARRRHSLYTYGEEQARKLGVGEEDVDRIIHEFRQEERERQTKEIGR